MGPAPKCHFVSKILSGSLEIPKIGTPTTLGAHNFVYRPLIEMKFEGKVVALVATLTLGSRSKQGVGRWWAKRKTRESLHMPPGVQRV